MTDRSTALVDVPSEVSAAGEGTGSQRFNHLVVDALAERLPNVDVAEWPGGHARHRVSIEPFLERMRVFQQRAGTGGMGGRY